LENTAFPTVETFVAATEVNVVAYAAVNVIISAFGMA
jgi:hypothetical protein